MAIGLPDILDERQIALKLKSRRQPNALRELADLFAKTGSVERPAEFLAQVLARETANSTLAENAIAFPHARTELVEEMTLAIGRSRAGIPWNSKGERARLIFVVAVPKQLVNDYLVVVGTLARITKDDERRKMLLEAATPAEFIETLRAATSL